MLADLAFSYFISLVGVVLWSEELGWEDVLKNPRGDLHSQEKMNTEPFNDKTAALYIWERLGSELRNQ